MTIESQLAEISKIVTEQANESHELKTAIEDSWQEIDKVHALAKQNHQAARDWQTKTGQVTFKDLNDAEYQVDTLATLINETQKINPHPEVMTKAQFDALRQMRKQQYAGSGFVEWGKHMMSGNHHPINDGMYDAPEDSLETNSLRLGRYAFDGMGVSSSPNAVVVVDGVQITISKSGVDLIAEHSVIRFPPAPDGTKTYDSATGTVTQHASAAEAFGGLVINNNFSDGLTGWNVWGGGTLALEGQIAQVKTANPSDGVTYFDDGMALQKNVEYVTEWVINYPQGKHFVLGFYNATDNEKITKYVGTGKPTVYRATYKPTADMLGTNIRCYHASGGDTELEWQVHSASLRPATEQVITSRKDLVFLESWHEKIADKDVVYPLGNVQYGASSYQGIALANNLVAQGYFAFGEWDTDTKGYGVKWSTLSAKNRIKFLKNPEHNIYYDPEAKAYIQVRYRVRVVEGHGDNWQSVGANSIKTHGYLTYQSGDAIKPRGSQVNVADYTFIEDPTRIGYISSESVQANNAAIARTKPIAGQYGICKYGSADPDRTINHAYQSKCFAVPIALVQRLNQGAYHPVHNPMGTTQYTMTGVRNYHWCELPTSLHMSTLGCFIPPTETSIGRHPGMGYIGGHGHSRTDQYKYYDAIYAGLVEDLRLNANKLDVNQLREDTMRKAVAGTLRGKGKVLFTQFKALHKGYLHQSNQWNASFVDALENGTSLNFYDNGFAANTPVMVWQPATNTTLYGQISTSNSHMMLTSSLENLGKQKHIHPISLTGLTTTDICYFAKVTELSSEYDSLPWTDIVGHPERIVATFPDGVIGQWIPILPQDGTTLFKLNKKLKGELSSEVTVNNGAQWSKGGAGSAFYQATNTWEYVSQENEVRLIHYEAQSNFTQPENAQTPVSDIGSVLAMHHLLIRSGNRLAPSLTGKILQGNDHPINELIPVSGHSYLSGEIFSVRDSNIKHRDVSLKGTNVGNAVKSLLNIVEKNGLLYMQCQGAELKYNGSSWGDDNTIPFIDGENTKTDLNGNTVKVFCHHTQLPLGIASH